MDLKSSPSSLQNLVSFYIAKLFWNKSFKSPELYLSGIYHDGERTWERQLTVCRDETISNVNIFIENYKLTSPLRTILTESVFSLHEAYHQLLLWKITYDSNNKIDVLQVGEFYAPNFFSANGKFNDYLWTKCLMNNQNYPKAFRFSLASVYYFDSYITVFWNELLGLYDIPVEDGFNVFGVCNEFRMLKRYFKWVERQFQNRNMDCDCPLFIFSFARNGYEYGVYGKWNRLSSSQQLALMMNDTYFEIINGRMDFPRCNISYFLYSQLSEERKKDFFQWSQRYDSSEMWLSLLFTSSGGHLHFEILEFISKLPFSIFSKLLQLLSHRIRQLRFPLDAELFEMLWTQVYLKKYRHELLDNVNFIIENLFKAKSFHNIGCVIKSFSLAQKEKCLFDGLNGSGINILYILCKEGEFDFLEKYLSFFLDEENSRNIVYNLRRKDIPLLKKFSESFEFQTWCKNELSKTEQTEVKSRISSLMTSSPGHPDFYKGYFVESSRISVFEKHFEVKMKNEVTYPSSSRQKRNIEKEIKPAKIKKM